MLNEARPQRRKYVAPDRRPWKLVHNTLDHFNKEIVAARNDNGVRFAGGKGPLKS